DAGRDAKSRESARPATEGDSVEVLHGKTRLPQQFIGHRQEPVRMASADDVVALRDFAIEKQGCGASLRGRIDREDLHASSAAGTTTPARARRRRRNDAASSRSAVIVAGGSDDMNS